MSDPRDERVAAAIRDLPVPEHGPEFWDRLERALETPAPRRRRRLRRTSVRLAAAAVGAAVAAIVFGLPGGGPSQRALADELKARVETAIADLRDVRARGVARFEGDPPQRFAFALTAAGDMRLSGPRFGPIAYDAERGVERQVIGSPPALYVERRGVAPGPPDMTATQVPAEQQIGAAIRALLAADDPRVTEVTWNGRPAWQAVMPLDPETSYSGADRLVLVVDQQTALPLSARATRGQRLVYEIELDRLRVNTGIPDRAFDVRFPPSADVQINREGFSRTTFAGAARVAGYEPIVPSWLPDGFERTAVAAAKRDRFTGPDPESGQGNPRGRDVISLAYRRGLDQITITTRHGGDDRWVDPFPTSDVAVQPETVTLSRGALAGVRAQVVVGGKTLPHLWALDDGLVLTVGGPLSRGELIRVAESLQTP